MAQNGQPGAATDADDAGGEGERGANDGWVDGLLDGWLVGCVVVRGTVAVVVGGLAVGWVGGGVVEGGAVVGVEVVGFWVGE